MIKWLIHFLFWSVFFLMWNRIMYFYVDNNLNSLYFTAIDVSLVIIAFYTVYLYVMPAYLAGKSVPRLLILMAALTLVLWGLYAWMTLLFLRNNVMDIRFEFTWNYKDLQYNRFFIALLGVLAGCFVKLAIDRAAVSKRIETMEKEKSMAELTYLKAQINPHFLFNSLNGLYTQLEINSPDAKNTLASLADLLRYQLYECNADRIPVNKEIAYLENYFKLQSIRNDNCRSEFIIDKPTEPLSIAPLLLVPFIENAFKYVSDNDNGQNFITVTINIKGRQFYFCCANSINPKAISADSRGERIGLINVKKRLELIYGRDYQLDIEATDEQYKVQLTLFLT